MKDLQKQSGLFAMRHGDSAKREAKPRKKANELGGKEWLQYSVSIWSGVKKTPEELKLAHPAMFPVNIVLRLLKCFTNQRQDMVLDPFVGSGTTLIAAKALGKNSIGFDISEEYVKLCRQRVMSQGELFQEKSCQSKVVLDSALNLTNYLGKESVDICITSPPYWNILKQKRTADMKETRDYEEKEGNLGDIDNYNRFIRELANVFENVYIVLRRGCYCIVNVMDIRKRSTFYPLHSDLAESMQSIGFIYDDLIIWDRRHEYNNFRPLGYPAVFRINRAHEFLMIFRKRA